MAASPLRAFGAPRARRDFEGKIDTRRRRKFKEQARALPRTPGVYFFYGINERLLYVGKAKSLRDRVRSYFADTKLQRPPKLRRLLAEIQRMEVQHCGSELEALLLERRLIAERRPILNRQLKRFDVYPYLLLSDEQFPRLTLTRAEPLSDGEDVEEHDWDADIVQLAEKSTSLPLPQSNSLPLETPPRVGELPGLYLGPFTTPRAAFWTMEAVRNLFPLRTCEGDIKPDPNGRACFYHDIGRCLGPCVEAVTASDYQQLCDDLLAMLHGGESERYEKLRARMTELAEEWRFEDAAKLKEQLQAIEMVAARLRRLQRMREENNVIITQPALRDGSTLSATIEGEAVQSTLNVQAGVFLVRGGVVRRHIIVRDDESCWSELKSEIQSLYSAPPPSAPFTAKSELDEMMILDRWLQANGKDGCCAWMNEKPSRMWATNATRKVQKWARSTCA